MIIFQSGTQQKYEYSKCLPGEWKPDLEWKPDFFYSLSILSNRISMKNIFLLLNEVECNEVAHILYTDHIWM
jgi:hypothetical protein